MPSFVNNENMQLQAKASAPVKRQKKLTREEQLVLWKKKKAALGKKNGRKKSNLNGNAFGHKAKRFDRIKNIQKRLNHSGKKRREKEKKVRRIDEGDDNKRSRSLLTQRGAVKYVSKRESKNLTADNHRMFHKSIRGIVRSPHHIVKSPHRISTLQQRLSNSAAKRKEKEQKISLLKQKQKEGQGKPCSLSKRSSKINARRRGSILKKEVNDITSVTKVQTSIKQYNVSKHCDSPSSFDVDTEDKNMHRRTCSDTRSKNNKTVNVFTPTVKKIYNSKSYDEVVSVNIPKHINDGSKKENSQQKKESKHGRFPLFHVHSPAVQKVVKLFSPLMSPLIKRNVIAEESNAIKEEYAVGCHDHYNTDSEQFDDLSIADSDQHERASNISERDTGGDDEKFIAPKDISKVRQAPSSVIKMKKIKLNTKDQANTGSRHAITPVRRSVRNLTADEDEAQLSDVNFVFQPNKHLDNAYFSDNKMSMNRIFQIQTKDGSFRRSTPRPINKKSATELNLPIFNGSNNKGDNTSSSTSINVCTL